MVIDKNLAKMFGLLDKVAIVTGASRGLGKGMAIGLAEAGANVIAVSTNKDNLKSTVEEITNYGGSVLAETCDVSKKEHINKIVELAKNEFGRIDILINNAGTIKRAPAEEHPDEYWERVIDVNLNSVFYFCREAGKVMINQKSGKIINIASLLSFSGGITVPSYAASKGGVAQLTKALANEWAKYNVQVNAIAPGYFATDNTKKLLEDPVRNEQISARIPATRWGKPTDLKGPAVFLASSASDYVNGHILLVDGGWMAR
jgi:2-deoxy-D-gluconate 3-dehydrogenase